LSDLKADLASLRIDKAAGARARPRRWPIVLVVVLLLAVLVFLLAGPRAAEVGTVQPTVAAKGGAGAPLLTASGYVVARRKAVVSAKIQGRLAALRVEEGSRVREGDILARLESADQEALVSRARAQVQKAEADAAEDRRLLRQAESLSNDKVLSADALEAAQNRVQVGVAELAQAKADLDTALAQLQNTVIRAPFTGTVVKKMAEVGESVAPIPPGVNLSTSSGAIVALADLATLEVEADVSESNVAKLGDEQPAEVTVEAFPDRRYRAVLRQVIPTADRTKATVQVKVTILESDPALRPEMSAKVTFMETASAAASGPRLTVPEQAIVTRDGKTYVFEIVDGKAHARPIETGAAQAGQVVVKQGLTGQETLVAQPPAGLAEGARVRVKASS
jgi:RND family efflux transporter MFP subunit